MRAAIALDGHELGTYLRVDELAHRFDVSVDDVLAACSVLGFAAHDHSSLIEVAAFTEAVKSAPAVRQAAPQPRPRALFALSAAAALIAVVAAFVAVGRDPSGPAADRDANLSAARVRRAAYQSELKSTYDTAVADAATEPDYRALAQQLAAITPPADYSVEHAALVAEAETVADLVADVSSGVETTSAVDDLRDHLSALEGTLTP